MEKKAIEIVKTNDLVRGRKYYHQPPSNTKTLADYQRPFEKKRYENDKKMSEEKREREEIYSQVEVVVAVLLHVLVFIAASHQVACAQN